MKSFKRNQNIFFLHPLHFVPISFVFISFVFISFVFISFVVPSLSSPSLSSPSLSSPSLSLPSLYAKPKTSSLKNEADLLAGEVKIKTQKIKGASMPQLFVEAIFNAPPQEVWKLLVDCSKYTKTMLSVKKSRVLGTFNGKVRCELIVNLPWPMNDLRSVTDTVLTVKPNTFYKREWSLVEGDYTVNQGSWTLEARAGGTKTYIYYIVFVEPKTSVPGFIKRIAQKSKIPDLFEHLRKQVEPKSSD